MTGSVFSFLGDRSGRLLETVYTFPLAHGVSLLGLSVTLGDKKMSGAVIEKREATQRYEQAIDAGDTPVLVEQSSPGLYTGSEAHPFQGVAVLPVGWLQ